MVNRKSPKAKSIGVAFLYTTFVYNFYIQNFLNIFSVKFVLEKFSTKFLGITYLIVFRITFSDNFDHKLT